MLVILAQEQALDRWQCPDLPRQVSRSRARGTARHQASKDARTAWRPFRRELRKANGRCWLRLETWQRPLRKAEDVHVALTFPAQRVRRSAARRCNRMHPDAQRNAKLRSIPSGQLDFAPFARADEGHRRRLHKHGVRRVDHKGPLTPKARVVRLRAMRPCRRCPAVGVRANLPLRQLKGRALVRLQGYRARG
jgi:hypothetical protein